MGGGNLLVYPGAFKATPVDVYRILRTCIAVGDREQCSKLHIVP